jgi:hypothetical protein
MIRILSETPSSNAPQYDFTKTSSAPLINPDQQIKYHRIYIVAPSPNYYQMDIAFFGNFKYLIMVGVNNRYAWAVGIPNKKKITIDKALAAIMSYKSFRNKPITKPRIIYIDCDGERSFMSIATALEAPKFLLSDTYKYGAVKIKINSKPDPYHNRLSIMNRLIRTLRSYAYNAQTSNRRPQVSSKTSRSRTATRIYRNGPYQTITPELLTDILYSYNHAPHRTLSSLTGFNTSPADLLNDIDLEAFAAKKLLHANLVYEKERFKIGDTVCVYHIASGPFEKRRYEMEQGLYEITERIGNMYRVAEIGVPPGLIANVLTVPGFLLVKI